MIRSAHDVFKSPEFSADELARIFTAAAGRTLYFGSTDRSDLSHRSDLTQVLCAYARGDSWRTDLAVSVRRFYQVLAAERKNCSTERVLVFQKEGLSLRQLAVLYDRSVPTIQRLLEGKSDGSNPTNPTDSAPKEA
jgi:hypothetical protein